MTQTVVCPASLCNPMLRKQLAREKMPCPVEGPTFHFFILEIKTQLLTTGYFL